MVSAKKDDIDKIRGLGLGADDYMTKPFSPSELVARVKAHLARYDRLIGSAAEKNKIIEIRGLKIDTTARRVWVNGEEKTFTTKEFDLLAFLNVHGYGCDISYGFHIPDFPEQFFLCKHMVWIFCQKGKKIRGLGLGADDYIKIGRAHV